MSEQRQCQSYERVVTHDEWRSIVDARRLLAIEASDSDELSAEARFVMHGARKHLAERIGGLFAIVDWLH